MAVITLGLYANMPQSLSVAGWSFQSLPGGGFSYSNGAQVLTFGNNAAYYSAGATGAGSSGFTINYLTGLAWSLANVMPGLLAGDDLVFGNALDNTLYGYGGNDSLLGYAGNDRIYGGDGNDSIDGGIGNDVLYGGDGGDTLYGAGGNDVLLPGRTIAMSGFTDVVNGGDGVDTANFADLTQAVTANLFNGTATSPANLHNFVIVNATLVSIENLTGGGGNDVLIGNNANNVLYGGAGGDTIYGYGGNDRLEGQAGDDVLSGGDGNDVLGGGDGKDGLFAGVGNDALYGGGGNDYLAGDIGDDVLSGDAGNDSIDAGFGNDFVVLGAGDDFFRLGAGDDRVRFDYGNGRDTIVDFGNGRDVIDFTWTDMTLAALQANAVETSAGVLLQVGSGSILLAGLQMWQIEWDTDFAFA